MSWVQVFPVGDANTADLERFITKNARKTPTHTQIEQASYNFRVGYALFESPDDAQRVSRELNKSEFNNEKVHALPINPVEDEYGILVGPKGFVQEGNYDGDKGSRYYPGQQTLSPAAGSSKRHTNRRSYQQQQTDPRNFGGIANKYNDDVQPENQPSPQYQQNVRYPQSSFGRPQQLPDQGFDQRSMGMGNDEIQYEKMSSQSKDSKSKSSKHRRHRRNSSDSSSSSSSSSDSSYSSPKQSRHKHRHHHHHHRKSK